MMTDKMSRSGSQRHPGTGGDQRKSPPIRRRPHMTKLTRILAASAVALSLSVPAFAKEFRSADVHPDDYPTVMAVKKMSEIISAKTGGKYTIKVFGNSALGSEKD